MMTLVLASGSALAGPVQWNSVDSLVTATNSINTTLDAAIKRVGGVESGIGASGGNVTPNGYLETSATLLSTQQQDDYNLAVMNVQSDIFQKTAAEYFAEEYEAASIDFSNQVDAFVSAATQIVIASHVGNMAQQVQASGDAIQGQQLQAYVLNNEVLITTAELTAFNDAQTVLQDSADQFAAVAAVYNDPQLINNFQVNADANGVDFLNADSVFLDRIENQALTGFQAGVVVDFTSTASLLLVEDISANIQTTEFFNNAGATGFFYQEGPTQNPEATCQLVNGVLTGTFQNEDPAMPCYLQPMP